MAAESLDKMTVWAIIGVMVVGVGVLVYANITLSQQLMSVQGDVAELKATAQALEEQLRDLSPAQRATARAAATFAPAKAK